ncbi:MAG: ASCH domain-containing protein [Vulcanimicrobiaceae bacterium]
MSALVVHSPSSRAMWEAFLEARQLAEDTPCSLVALGGIEAQDDLAALVLHGPKRATTTLLRWYGAGGERYPIAGDYFVVVDARKTAFCVAETTRVRECAFRDVDPAHAFVEGEGDRSLDGWRAEHRAVFAREATLYDFVFDDDTHVVLMTFRVVWPIADAT